MGGLEVIHIAKMALLVISDVGEKGLGNKAVAEFGGQRQSRWGGEEVQEMQIVLFWFSSKRSGWSWHAGGGRRVSSCEQEESRRRGLGLRAGSTLPTHELYSPSLLERWGGQVGVSWDTHF